jgi:Zn-dependent M28 family amino/carboxypeptidase
LAFCLAEGAALTITPSTTGDGGTVFVTSSAIPTGGARGGGTGAPRVYSTNAPAIPPQVMMAVEDYNRLVRMIQLGEKPKMSVELQVQFHDEDLMAYNTVAEIPGTDLKDEVVMIGGHLDSWHVGTGATDNGAGVAAAMEAMRILKTLDLKPRRTIRIGLWSGEEQGLMGSRAYVGQHFGYDTNTPPSEPLRSPRAASNEPSNGASSSTNTVTRQVRKKEFDKLSVYFNVDNGAGKIRGVYLQGNEAVRPLFRSWLEPFNDLGADTLTLSNTGSTDHVPFDNIGLPGFQFIQDPLEYTTRTHHSNADVFDRVPPDDLKQIATIFAAFAYNAAMTDEKVPRKPTSR